MAHWVGVAGILTRGGFLALSAGALVAPAWAEAAGNDDEAVHRFVNEILATVHRGRLVRSAPRAKKIDFLPTAFPSYGLGHSQESPYLIWETPQHPPNGKALYAAHDHASGRLLVAESQSTYGNVMLTALHRPPHPLQAMSLSSYRTEGGFTIGSSERAIVERFGEGTVYESGILRTRSYVNDCAQGIDFRFARRQVVEIRCGDDC